MGQSDSSKDKDIIPTWPTQLGVFEEYCLHETEVVLKLREKKLSLSGDSFEITTANDIGFLKAQPSLISLTGRNVLRDSASGRPVLTITQKPFSLHKEFRIFEGESGQEQLVTVRGKIKLIGSPEMTVNFKNKSDGKEVELNVTGEFLRRNATISCEGQPVAKISNSFMNNGQILFNQQTYYLKIAPRVDSAMMVAICICLDEKNEKNN